MNQSNKVRRCSFAFSPFLTMKRNQLPCYEHKGMRLHREES